MIALACVIPDIVEKKAGSVPHHAGAEARIPRIGKEARMSINNFFLAAIPAEKSTENQEFSSANDISFIFDYKINKNFSNSKEIVML